MRGPAVLLFSSLSVAVLTGAVQSLVPQRDVGGWMTRVGERIEQYYARAHSIMCEETVRLEPLGFDVLSNGTHVRELVYELRVAWDGAADADSDTRKTAAATVLRQLLSVDGRPPRAGDEPGCMDPKPVSPEPLGLLLPHRQSDYIFSWRGQGRERGRASVTLDYKPARVQPPNIVWTDNCVSVDLPGRTHGRVWLDQSTGDVLRLDEELTGQYELAVPKAQTRQRSVPARLIVERADSSIAYRLVAFHDPEEAVMLPESLVSLQIIRNSGTPRLRTTQRFSKYRRFMTGAKIVEDQGPR
jgi:hypothetical protein